MNTTSPKDGLIILASGLFFWLLAEGAVEYLGLHITLLAMSLLLAVLANKMPATD